MPSPRAEFLKKQIQRLRPILNNASIKSCRSAQDRLGAVAAKALEEKVRFSELPCQEFQTCMITPVEQYPSNKVLLYLHGGGYTAGSIQYAKGFGSVLAAETGLPVLCAAYRLAPENPFPAAVEDACSAYQYLLDSGWAPGDVIFSGESAGGGLIYALGQYLVENGKPLPGAFIALSPWTDLTFSGESHRFNREADPSLSLETLQFYARSYASWGEVKSPLVSPVFGTYTGFPPSLIFVGGAEILLSDAEMLAERLEECGASCELHVEEGLWHVYVLYPMPESEQAIQRIVSFIREQENPSL